MCLQKRSAKNVGRTSTIIRFFDEIERKSGVAMPTAEAYY